MSARLLIYKILMTVELFTSNFYKQELAPLSIEGESLRSGLLLRLRPGGVPFETKRQPASLVPRR